MLSTRLVHLIESHAEELTRGLVSHLRTHPRTPSYRRHSDAELHSRGFNVYRNLGAWLTAKHEQEIREAYEELGRQRFAEGIPLSEVIYALIITKNHLLDFAKTSGEAGTALEIFGEKELADKVVQFFDRAAYYTAAGYEQAQRGSHPARA